MINFNFIAILIVICSQAKYSKEEIAKLQCHIKDLEALVGRIEFSRLVYIHIYCSVNVSLIMNLFHRLY